MNNNLSIIGIAGGSGSGKTYLCNKINKLFKENILIIKVDSYYKDLSHMKFFRELHLIGISIHYEG